MSDDRPKRSLFPEGLSVGRSLAQLLRRDKKRKDDESLRHQGEVWSAHERALSSLREATEASQKVSSLVTKEREAVEHVIARTSSLNVKCTESREKIRGVIEALDRLSLVSMNAALESARHEGTPAAQALSLFAEEVRNLSSRGVDAGHGAISSVEELEHEASEVSSLAERAHARLLSAHGATRAMPGDPVAPVHHDPVVRQFTYGGSCLEVPRRAKACAGIAARRFIRLQHVEPEHAEFRTARDMRERERRIPPRGILGHLCVRPSLPPTRRMPTPPLRQHACRF